jgi:site-specific recombinase XerD
MLSEYFDSAERIEEFRAGRAGPFFEGFARKLYEAGYAEITARRHLRAAEHLIYWAGRRDTAVGNLTEESLERFGRHFGRCRCARYGRSHRVDLLNGARLFFKHLRDVDLLAVSDVRPVVQDPPLLSEFRDWMRQQRGTREITLVNYSNHIRPLLRRLGEKPEKLDAKGLRQFVLDVSRGSGWAKAKTCTTALRMFLRFLIAEGKCATGLDAAVPVLPHWRLSVLPRYFQPDEVELLIASCDPTSPVGRRDRAILLLLARLGLRAGDIVQLRLGDIDWKGAWICVSGKGRRQARLPLTKEVGKALVAYLKDGRPQTHADAVFIRSRAPFRAFRSHAAVSVIVAQAIRRAGVTRPSRGAAHLLRHSVATSMLRQGASLQDVATLLRHRSIETTQIYAKVDVTALQRIAQPWPEVELCYAKPWNRT